MYSLNSDLEQAVLAAEGGYLSSDALEDLARYHRTYAVRLATYQYLRDHGDCLVERSLRHLQQLQPQVQLRTDHCSADMNAVLCILAGALLRNDEAGFQTQFVLWFSSVMAAHKKVLPQTVAAYRILKQEITRSVPTSGANLLSPYLNALIQALQSQACFQGPQPPPPPLRGGVITPPSPPSRPVLSPPRDGAGQTAVPPRQPVMVRPTEVSRNGAQRHTQVNGLPNILVKPPFSIDN